MSYAICCVVGLTLATFSVILSGCGTEPTPAPTPSPTQPVPNDTPTLRGGTWCEINAFTPDFKNVTVVACQRGTGIPGPQNASCCPLENYQSIWTPPEGEQLLPTGWNAPAAQFLFSVLPSDGPHGKYPLVMEDGQKKNLWDIGNGCQNMPVVSSSSPQYLVCPNLNSTKTADTRNSECMWMVNAGFSELPPLKDFIEEGSTAYQYQYTLFYPNRTFLKGKLQPLMRNGSSTYLLQSHPTLNATFPPHHEYIPGPNATTVGEQANICDWIELITLPQDANWTVECGLLSEDAYCGYTCEGNQITLDDLGGTWCLTNFGASVEPPSRRMMIENSHVHP